MKTIKVTQTQLKNIIREMVRNKTMLKEAAVPSKPVADIEKKLKDVIKMIQSLDSKILDYGYAAEKLGNAATKTRASNAAVSKDFNSARANVDEFETQLAGATKEIKDVLKDICDKDLKHVIKDIQDLEDA